MRPRLKEIELCITVLAMSRTALHHHEIQTRELRIIKVPKIWGK